MQFLSPSQVDSLNSALSAARLTPLADEAGNRKILVLVEVSKRFDFPPFYVPSNQPWKLELHS